MGPKIADYLALLIDRVDDLAAKVDVVFQRDDKSMLDTLSATLNDLSAIVQDLSLKIDNNQLSIANDIKNIRESMIEKLVVENKKMSKKITSLDDKVLVLERQVNLNSQRSRENNIEFQGIHGDIKDVNLENVVLAIIKSLKIENVGPRDIQGVHRLPLRKSNTYKPVIAKFINRKIPELIMRNKKSLAKINLEEIGLPNESKIYVNLNLSDSFKCLDYHCRKLKTDGLIFSTVASHAMLKIKFEDGNDFEKITHLQDLVDLFPDRIFEQEKFPKKKKK